MSKFNDFPNEEYFKTMDKVNHKSVLKKCNMYRFREDDVSSHHFGTGDCESTMSISEIIVI